MAFAIKAEVVDPQARTFAFTAHKTMYGGKLITEGDTVFVFKFYRQATNKIVGISNKAAAFLSKCF
jgi:hypothetical protein